MKKIVLNQIKIKLTQDVHIFEARKNISEIEELIKKLHFKSDNDLDKILERINSIRVNALSVNEVNRGLDLVYNLIEEKAVGDHGIEPMYLNDLTRDIEKINNLTLEDLTGHITDPSLLEEYTYLMNNIELAKKTAESLRERLT